MSFQRARWILLRFQLAFAARLRKIDRIHRITKVGSWFLDEGCCKNTQIVVCGKLYGTRARRKINSVDENVKRYIGLLALKAVSVRADPCDFVTLYVARSNIFYPFKDFAIGVPTNHKTIEYLIQRWRN